MFDKVKIFYADFPAVDPNIVHQYSELKAEGFCMVPKSRVLLDLEHIVEYGTQVDVEVTILDLYNIKNDYKLKEIPRLKLITTDAVVLSTQNSTFEIPKTEIREKYLLSKMKEYSIVYKEELYSIYNTEEFYNELTRVFLEEKNTSPRKGACYSISINMACIISHYFKNVSLFKYFNHGKSQLFISFE